MEAYKKYWLNYFNFSGRSTRSEYRTPLIINGCIAILLICLNRSMMGRSPSIEDVVSALVKSPAGIIMWLFVLATVIPNISSAFRRLHDTGNSGKCYVVYMVFGVICSVVMVFGLIGGVLSGIVVPNVISGVVIFVGFAAMIALLVSQKKMQKLLMMPTDHNSRYGMDSIPSAGGLGDIKRNDGSSEGYSGQ